MDEQNTERLRERIIGTIYLVAAVGIIFSVFGMMTYLK